MELLSNGYILYVYDAWSKTYYVFDKYMYREYTSNIPTNEYIRKALLGVYTIYGKVDVSSLSSMAFKADFINYVLKYGAFK